MDELMAPLTAHDWGGDRGALAGIDARIASALEDTAVLAEIGQALLKVLASEAKLPAKEYACRQLALIGTADAVPVLAEMLADETLSDCARMALEAIPDAAAGDALRAALATARGNARVGIVNTLGERRDKTAVPALEALRQGADSVLAGALASALRKIAQSA